ncbi:MAG: sulfotransferase domain-containing protein [Bacteroidetes bacterium]|nr:sulfotransferase domain-containing protein [Bacteroidota bacterium]
MKLHFVVAGFSKCGTTALCSMLMAHPYLFLPPRAKEPRFFCNEDYALNWNWYRNLFYSAPANALLGEGSVTYTETEFAHNSLKRLVKHFPKIKIILIARDPVDRIESSYREMHNSGTEWGIHCPYNIQDALVKMPNMLEDTKYGEILQLYRQHLPKEQIMVLFQEDLKSNSNAVLDQCFNFLGVASMSVSPSEEKALNQGTDKYYDTPGLREFRKIKLHPKVAKAFYRIPVSIQDQFLPQLHLRKPFGKEKLEWSQDARKHLLRVLGKGPQAFLRQQGKDISFWPRYAEFLNETSF